MGEGSWFVVAPEGHGGEAVAADLRRVGSQVVVGRAGSPWLVGSWPARQMCLAEAGPTRLAVIGRCAVSACELGERAAQLRSVADMDAALAGLAGSFHAVAAVGGRVRVRGNVCGERRVFQAELRGVSVAASRADVLARLVEAEPDWDVLALRLAAPGVVYPMEERCVWRQVRGVAPDHCLLLAPDGSAAIERWWRPPEPKADLPEAASAVRTAVVAAVDACAAAGGTISADLSGGLDSTSLCFLAARGPARLATCHWKSLDEINDDSAWAARAMSHLPDAEHVAFEASALPAWFAGVADLRLQTEQPSPWVRDHARLASVATRMAKTGSRLHLTGAGGDQLFTPATSWLHDIALTHPLKTVNRIRFERAAHRVPASPQLRGLLDRRGFARWLADVADLLTAPRPAPAAGLLAWDAEPRLPVWATKAAAEAARALLRRAAEAGPPPLAPQRAQHGALQMVRVGGDTLREVDRFFTMTAGLGYAAPYLDDAVVEAALSLRVSERGETGRFKPLLVEAMRGLAPPAVLARRNKGEYSVDHHAGVRRHRGELVAMLSSSRVAEAGLVDPDALREALLGNHPSPQPLTGLLETLAVEVWLRSLPESTRAGVRNERQVVLSPDASRASASSRGEGR